MSDRIEIFYKDDCAPCQRVKPTLQQLREYMSASTAIAWIDVNVEENKAYAKSVGVKTVPRIRVRDTDFSPTDLSLMTIVMKIKENIYE